MGIREHDIAYYRQLLRAGLIDSVSLPGQLNPHGGGGHYSSRPLITDYQFRHSRVVKALRQLPSFHLGWVLFAYRQDDSNPLEQELADWLHQQLLRALPTLRAESKARLPRFCQIAMRHFVHQILQEHPPVARQHYAEALQVSLANWDKQWQPRLNRAQAILQNLDIETIHRLRKLIS